MNELSSPIITSDSLYAQASPDSLYIWLMDAKPNDRFLYYRGYNLVDFILARELRKAAYKLATQGRVYLVQSRCLQYDGMFNYFVIKSSHPPVFKLIPYSDEKLKQLGKRVVETELHHGQQVH